MKKSTIVPLPLARERTAICKEHKPYTGIAGLGIDPDPQLRPQWIQLLEPSDIHNEVCSCLLLDVWLCEDKYSDIMVMMVLT